LCNKKTGLSLDTLHGHTHRTHLYGCLARLWSHAANSASFSTRDTLAPRCMAWQVVQNVLRPPTHPLPPFYLMYFPIIHSSSRITASFCRDTRIACSGFQYLYSSRWSTSHTKCLPLPLSHSTASVAYCVHSAATPPCGTSHTNSLVRRHTGGKRNLACERQTPQ
jgi:hypothetical protein